MPHRCTNCSETFPDGSKKMLSGCPRCGGNTFQYLPSDSVDEPPAESPPEPPEPPGVDSGVTETVGRAATTVREYVSRHRSDSGPSRSTSSASGSSHERPGSPASAGAADNGESAEAEATPSDRESTTAESTPTTEHPSTPEDADAAPSQPDESSQFTFGEQDDAEVATDELSDEDTAQASARGEVADLSELSGDGPEESAGPEPPRRDGRVVKEPDETDRPDLETLRAELNDQFESIKILEPGQYELNLMELYDREEHIIALQEDGKYVIEVPESWREEGPDQDDD